MTVSMMPSLARRQVPSTRAPNVPRKRTIPTHVSRVLEMANAATRYLRYVEPHLVLTKQTARGYIGPALGVDWSSGDAVGSELFDLNATAMIEERCGESVLAYVLRDKTVIVYRRDEDAWRWIPEHCRRCDRHLIGDLAERLHPPYCSLVCESGRVPKRALDKILGYLNARWARQLERVRAHIPTIDQEPDDSSYWGHGNSDKVMCNAPKMVAFAGIDWRATDRRQAEIGEHIGVFVLVDGRELVKSGIEPWCVRG
jgi:hypothetical protein